MVKVTKKPRVQNLPTNRCHRCGGLMVQEQVIELGSADWRCISCGERIDPVILSHRQKNLARTEPEKLFVSYAKSSLN